MSSMTLTHSMATLSILQGEITRAFLATENIMSILDLKPSIPITGGNQLAFVNGNLTFKDVVFFYPTRPEHKVLRGISLNIAEGKVHAICGSSGSGKTTLANLIERYYDPTHGEILLDGHKIDSLDPSWLRKKNCICFTRTNFICNINWRKY